MNWRRKHRSCLCEVLLPRILKQQKTLTVLQKHSLKNQTRSEKQTNVHNGKKTNGNYNRKKTATAINYNRKKTSTVNQLCPLPHTARQYIFSVKHTNTQKLRQITLTTLYKTQFDKSNPNRKQTMYTTARRPTATTTERRLQRQTKLCPLPHNARQYTISSLAH